MHRGSYPYLHELASIWWGWGMLPNDVSRIKLNFTVLTLERLEVM